MNSLRELIASLLVAACSVVVFLPLLDAGYVLDDEEQLLHNPAIRQLDLHAIFGRGYWENVSESVREFSRAGDVYRPITTLSLALGVRRSGPEPWGLHLENLLLHALAAVLVLSLLRAWGCSSAASFVGGLLFGVAPVHIEPIASIVVRSDILAAIFSLACLRCLASGRRWLERLGAPLACFLALLSKESAIALLALAPLADHLALRLDRAQWRARLPAYAGLALAAAAYLALRLRALGHIGSPDPSILYFTGDSTLVVWLTMARFALEHYLSACLLGGPLIFDYSPYAFHDVSPRNPWAWLCLFGWLGLGASALYAALRQRRAWTLGPLFFLVALAPTANVLLRIGVIGATRLVYLPYLGVVVALLQLGSGLWRRLSARATRAAFVLGAIALLGYYASVSQRRLAPFAHPYTLVLDILDHAPDNSYASINSGNLAMGFAQLTRVPPPAFQTVSREDWLERAFQFYARGVRAFPYNWDLRPQNVIFSAFESGHEQELFELMDLGLRAHLPMLRLPPLPAPGWWTRGPLSPAELALQGLWSRSIHGAGLHEPIGQLMTAVALILPDYCELKALHRALVENGSLATAEQRPAWRARARTARENLHTIQRGPAFPPALSAGFEVVFAKRLEVDADRWLDEIEADGKRGERAR